MATLEIDATPSDDLQQYRLNVDGIPLSNTGSVVLPGAACGDGSTHYLNYTLVGPEGAKLSIKMRCTGGADIEIPDVEIFEFSPAGGAVEFVL